MMNLSFQEKGIDARYHLCETSEKDLEATVTRLIKEGAAGFNVTMPDKSAMCALCSSLSDAAAVGGAVNTVKNENGKLLGYTTDGEGFLKAAGDIGFSAEGSCLSLLGSGGAASSILIACALKKAREIIVFCHRPSSKEHILEIKSKLRAYTDTRITICGFHDPACMEEAFSRSSLLVNATNVGMADDSCPVPDTVALPAELSVFDVIYNPRKTALLKIAEKAGCRTANGLRMLLYQGEEAFRIWTGQDMPVQKVMQTVFPGESSDF